MKKLLVPALAALLATTALAAEASAVTAKPAPAATSVVAVNASKGGLKYTKTLLRAKAGRIEIVFTNPSPLRHNVRVESGETELGGTKTIATGRTTAFVTLKPGKYHFYCSVPGHEDAGMQGYIVVS